jgi:ferredoxin
MEIRVDPDICIGAANCVQVAERVFELGDDGVAHVIDPDGAPPDTIREAERACPVAAIEVEEGPA